MSILQEQNIRDAVRKTYGAIAREERRGCGGGDGCCGGGQSTKTDPRGIGYTDRELAAGLSEANLGLGCGNPHAVAALKPGETVLDFGSGGGFDCFIAAAQVGETGHVIGVDMTPDMVSRARRQAVEHGIANVEFRLGEIEALPVPDGSVDVILSNCVLNLSPNKPAVFREAFRVLKPGGRLSIADMVATAPIPEAVRNNLESVAGCVGNAATAAELEAMMRDAGFRDIRIERNRFGDDGDAENSGDSGALAVSMLLEAVRP